MVILAEQQTVARNPFPRWNPQRPEVNLTVMLVAVTGPGMEVEVQ